VQTEWRVACVRIPRFPIGAVRHAQERGNLGKADAQLLLLPIQEDRGPAGPASSRHAKTPNGEKSVHWDNQLLALTDGAPNRPKLRSVSAAAARVGVRAGMTLAEGRALCAELEVLPWDDVAVTSAITETTATFVHASPQV